MYFTYKITLIAKPVSLFETNGEFCGTHWLVDDSLRLDIRRHHGDGSGEELILQLTTAELRQLGILADPGPEAQNSSIAATIHGTESIEVGTYPTCEVLLDREGLNLHKIFINNTLLHNGHEIIECLDYTTDIRDPALIHVITPSIPHDYRPSYVRALPPL